MMSDGIMGLPRGLTEATRLRFISSRLRAAKIFADMGYPKEANKIIEFLEKSGHL